MARMAISDFLASVQEVHGQEETNKIWRRIQAGYHLADSVRTTPKTFKEIGDVHVLEDLASWDEGVTLSEEVQQQENSSGDHNYLEDLEQRLLAIFRAKAHAAQGLHSTAAGKIAGRSIGEWLTPEGLQGDQGIAFMEALGSSRAWIIRGEDYQRSRLIKQCEWGGKMFGSALCFDSSCFNGYWDWLTQVPFAGLSQVTNLVFLKPGLAL